MERKIEGKSGFIFDSAMEGLKNELFRCQRLQEVDGINTLSLQDEIIDKIRLMSEMSTDERLGALRKELKEL